MEARVIELREITNETKQQRLNVDSILAVVRKYTEVRELGAEIIRSLVERIDMFKPEKVPGTCTKRQTVMIHWSFIGAVNLLDERKNRHSWISPNYADSFIRDTYPLERVPFASAFS